MSVRISIWTAIGVAIAVAAIIGAGVVALNAVATTAGEKPDVAQKVLEAALRLHREDRGFDPFAKRAPDSLRGITHADANRLLAACGYTRRWIFAGEEHHTAFDCGGYELAWCEVGNSRLVARLWVERDSVDHIADLALSSEFLACRIGQCPDFAVGEPRAGSVDSCGTPFKVNQRASQP